MFNPQFWFRGSARTSAGVGDPGPKECEQMEPSVALEAELMGLGKGSELTIALAHESA